MRGVTVAILAGLLLASCSKAPPPTGRWEGAYESGDTMVAARLEVETGGLVRVSAPDVSGVGDAADDRATMRENMSERLAGGWGEIAPRPMDFDGTTFRLPGRIAPQIDWDSRTNVMTLYVYLGTQPAIHLALHPVADFTDNPWGR